MSYDPTRKCKTREGVLDRIIALQTEVAIQPIYEGMPAMYADSIAALAESGLVPSGFSR